MRTFRKTDGSVQGISRARSARMSTRSPAPLHPDDPVRARGEHGAPREAPPQGAQGRVEHAVAVSRRQHLAEVGGRRHARAAVGEGVARRRRPPASAGTGGCGAAGGAGRSAASRRQRRPALGGRSAPGSSSQGIGFELVVGARWRRRAGRPPQPTGGRSGTVQAGGGRRRRPSSAAVSRRPARPAVGTGRTKSRAAEAAAS